MAESSSNTPTTLAYECPFVRETKLLVRERLRGSRIRLPFRRPPIGSLFLEVIVAVMLWCAVIGFTASLFIAMFTVLVDRTPFPAFYFTMACAAGIWGYTRLPHGRYTVVASVSGIKLRHDSQRRATMPRKLPKADIAGFTVVRGLIPTFDHPFDVVATLKSGSAVTVIPVSNAVEGGWVITLIERALRLNEPVMPAVALQSGPSGAT